MIKIHARVTREIEITDEQAEKLVNYLCDSSEGKDINEILEMFKVGVHSGNYEEGYIPQDWIQHDLLNSDLNSDAKNYLNENQSNFKDIDL